MAGARLSAHLASRARIGPTVAINGTYAAESAPRIGGPAFTHIPHDDYRVIRPNLLEGKRTSIRGRLVLYTVFIDPQLGRVGLTEAEARRWPNRSIICSWRRFGRFRECTSSNRLALQESTARAASLPFPGVLA